jgi:hypothetical protein
MPLSIRTKKDTNPPPQLPGPACPNPPASATYRCALFKGPLFVDDKFNLGQNRVRPGTAEDDVFQTRIRGSNGTFNPF